MTTAHNLYLTHNTLKLHEANEAETRLKLIDRILSEVLGWSHDDISVEERVTEDGKTTFCDYLIRTANTNFIVEAKRIGATFSGLPNKRRIQISGALVASEAGDAIIQARDYCRKKGAQFGVVTNGAEWIIFPAVRTDVVEFKDSSAIIFPSLQSILQDHHSEFVALLSRNAVIDGSLETALLGKIEDQFGERRLKHFLKTGQTTRPPNPVFPLIEDAIITAFTDSLIDKKDLLGYCYVNTPDRRKFDRRIQLHLARREPIFRKRPERPMRNKDSSALKSKIETSSFKPRPTAILVLGTVGAGKTTFLNYTRLIATAEFFEPNKTEPYPHWIYIDFRTFKPSDVAKEVIEARIKQYFEGDHFFSNYEQCIRPAYAREIESLRTGAMKLLAADENAFNRELADIILTEYKAGTVYIKKLITYAATKAPVFIVVDNVDQIEDEKTQSEIFQAAMAFAHETNANLILAMREATYIKHRNHPNVDAYDFDPMVIEAPEVQPVLSRRFALAKQILAGKGGEFVAENGARVTVMDSSVIIDLIQSSVLGTEVGNVIDVLATSDIRFALRMTREFLESGYTAPGKALSVYRDSGQYVLPKHEALRSLILGKHTVYEEKYSVLGNPFDSHVSKTTSQLLRLFVLNALVNMATKGGFQSIEGIDIRDNLRRLGYGDELTLRILTDLCKWRFIFSASQREPDINSKYYPSRLGGYIIRDLIADTTFLENTMMDTFISDPEIWNVLREATTAIDNERGIILKLRLRMQRVKRFYAYMESLYLPIVEQARLRSLDNVWCGDPFQDMADELDRRIQKAVDSAIRNYPKK